MRRAAEKTTENPGHIEYMQRRHASNKAAHAAATAASTAAQRAAATDQPPTLQDNANRRQLMLIMVAWITEEIAKLEATLPPSQRSKRPAASSNKPACNAEDPADHVAPVAHATSDEEQHFQPLRLTPPAAAADTPPNAATA